MSLIWQVRVAMLVLGVLLAFRPGLGDDDVETVPAGSDLEVLLVVDQTVSMSALDYAGVRSRLEGVREDFTELVEQLPDSRFALVVFGKRSRVEVPFTTKADQLLEKVERLSREPLLAGKGTVVDRPLDDITEMLSRAAEQHPDRRRVIVFASDGEVTAANATQRSFAGAADYLDEGAVFGYGTEEGGLMPTGGEPPWTFVRDLSTGADARSHLDEENLKRIADELDVEYAHRNAPGGLDDWAQALRRGTPGTDEEPGNKYELYWVLALLIFGLAMVELRYDLREMLAARQELSR